MVDSQLLPVLKLRSGRRLIRQTDLERIVTGPSTNAPALHLGALKIEMSIINVQSASGIAHTA